MQMPGSNSSGYVYNVFYDRLWMLTFTLISTDLRGKQTQDYKMVSFHFPIRGGITIRSFCHAPKSRTQKAIQQAGEKKSLVFDGIK